jgi:hypothetical protein
VSHRPRARHHERSTTDGRHDSSRGIRSIRRLDRCAHSSPPVLIASYSPTTCVARESDTTGLCDPRATAQRNVQRPHDQERTERVRPDPADPLVAPTSLTDASWGRPQPARPAADRRRPTHLHPGAVKSLWGMGQGGFPRTDIKGSTDRSTVLQRPFYGRLYRGATSAPRIAVVVGRLGPGGGGDHTPPPCGSCTVGSCGHHPHLLGAGWSVRGAELAECSN